MIVLKRGLLQALLMAAICAAILKGFANAEIEPLRKIHLPVPSSRRSFGRFPIAGLSARDHFSMRVAPDQSILTFDSDASGNWLLFRVRRWWTDEPLTEVLKIPAWSTADAKHMDEIYVDIQVTSEGRYAVAFSGASWRQKSDFLLFPPKGYIERKPDTIISVIDLTRWQIVSSIHTASMQATRVRHARLASNTWIALDSDVGEPPSEHGAYRYLNRLISIPDLKPGPECISQRFSHLWRVPPDSVIATVNSQNDLACRDVFEATGKGSDEALRALIQRGSDVEPAALRLHQRDFIERRFIERNAAGDKGKLWMAESYEDQFFRNWGEYPYNHQVAENPPFESNSRQWYGFYDAHDSGLYELDIYDTEGVMRKSQTAWHLLCGDPNLTPSKAACGCRVIDVSEETHALLAYCRKQRGDFLGAVQREWLAVFRSDDLFGVGLIVLSTRERSLQAIASNNGRAYVLNVEFGEVLGVYAIPDEK